MHNESLVYLNKIFTDVCTHSCPLLTEFTASGENFTQQFSVYDGGDECGCGCSSNSCGCSSLDLDGDSTFVVESTQVIVSDFVPANPESLTANDVTINGIPVDSLDFFNERYLAATNSIMPLVSDCKCMKKGASTKGLLLIQNAGGWVARLTVILKGRVFGCGVSKQFRLVLTSAEDSPVSIPGTNTFAVTQICLPCTVGGISPVINFSFSASATLLNPFITIDTGTETCNVIVSGSLVTEPVANIQITRQTLFKTTAAVVELPCDGIAEPEPCSNDRCCDDADNNTENIHVPEPACATPSPCEPCKRNDQRPPQSVCQWNGCNGCGF